MSPLLIWDTDKIIRWSGLLQKALRSAQKKNVLEKFKWIAFFEKIGVSSNPIRVKIILLAMNDPSNQDIRSAFFEGLYALPISSDTLIGYLRQWKASKKIISKVEIARPPRKRKKKHWSR